METLGMPTIQAPTGSGTYFIFRSSACFLQLLVTDSRLPLGPDRQYTADQSTINSLHDTQRLTHSRGTGHLIARRALQNRQAQPGQQLGTRAMRTRVHHWTTHIPTEPLTRPHDMFNLGVPAGIFPIGWCGLTMHPPRTPQLAGCRPTKLLHRSRGSRTIS